MSRELIHAEIPRGMIEATRKREAALESSRVARRDNPPTWREQLASGRPRSLGLVIVVRPRAHRDDSLKASRGKLKCRNPKEIRGERRAGQRKVKSKAKEDTGERETAKETL